MISRTIWWIPVDVSPNVFILVDQPHLIGTHWMQRAWNEPIRDRHGCSQYAAEVRKCMKLGCRIEIERGDPCTNMATSMLELENAIKMQVDVLSTDVLEILTNPIIAHNPITLSYINKSISQ